jgi:hypothetical protein
MLATLASGPDYKSGLRVDGAVQRRERESAFDGAVLDDD